METDLSRLSEGDPVSPLDSAQLRHRAREVFALISTGDVSRAQALIHREYRDPRLPPERIGPSGFVAGLAMVRAAFPDWSSTPDELVVEGDRVGATWTVTGTHTGPFFGIPATGRKVQMREAGVLRFRDGQLVGIDRVADELSLLRQLGALPEGT